MQLLFGLNSEQQQAATSENAISLISAGPGTGKTRTLIERIVYLLHSKHTDPDSILAITFTNKAASELRERLQTILGADIKLPYIGTFHAFALFLMKESGKEIVLVSEEDRKMIIRTVKQQIQSPNISESDMSLHISKLKNAKSAGRDDNIVNLYNKLLHATHMLDYDDLLDEANHILSSDMGRVYLNRFRYVHVDEFQDTSGIQYQILEAFMKAGCSLFAIGDPRQSIYGFRGASAGVFESLANESERVAQFHLSQNYRSVGEIVTASQCLLGQQHLLKAQRTESGSVTIIETLDEYTEADLIVRELQKKVGGIDLIDAGNNKSHTATCRFSDNAILYRSHHIRIAIERRLFESGVPYQVIGAESPYEQPDIKYIIDRMRTVTEDRAVIKGPVSKLIAFFIHSYGIVKSSESELVRYLDLLQFQHTMSQFDGYADGLNRALSHIDYLSQREYYDPNADRITLMTIHSSKGLEFQNVFIAGFEDGIIPSVRKGSKSDLEEERRLLYVAMTRAKDNLYCVRPRERRHILTKPSRFEELFAGSAVKLVDPEIAKIVKKRIRKNDKKNQLKMF